MAAGGQEMVSSCPDDAAFYLEPNTCWVLADNETLPVQVRARAGAPPPAHPTGRAERSFLVYHVGRAAYATDRTRPRRAHTDALVGP